MKYFITGITGFLGKHLASGIREVNKKAGIIGLSRNPRNLAFFKELNIKLIKGDLNNIKNLKGTNSVIHSAALLKKGTRLLETNIKGTKNLLEACKKDNVKNIIFISSYLADPVYKGIYGQTKLEAEQLIRKSGLNFIILRPSLIYGENDNKNLTKLVNLIKKIPFIPVFGKGNYYLQPVYVKDIVNVINFILKKNIFNKKTYNLTGQKLTYNQIIDQICKNLNKKRIKIHIPLKLLKILVTILPNPFINKDQIYNLTLKRDLLTDNKTNKDLNFKPTSFKQGLKSIINE